MFLCSSVVASSLSNSIPQTGSIGIYEKKLTRYLLFPRIIDEYDKHNVFIFILLYCQ
jgi:hypothetical protein